jgi:dolichol-phosphate mannosyltransferase
MGIFPEGSGLENLRDKVTVVILTLNEAEAVGPLIEEVKACGYRNILVVDGYSTDGTDKIASSLGAKLSDSMGRARLEPF